MCTHTRISLRYIFALPAFTRHNRGPLSFGPRFAPMHSLAEAKSNIIDADAGTLIYSPFGRKVIDFRVCTTRTQTYIYNLRSSGAARRGGVDHKFHNRTRPTWYHSVDQQNPPLNPSQHCAAHMNKSQTAAAITLYLYVEQTNV